MEFTAAQIADVVNGEVVGDSNAIINDVCKIEEGKPNAITFMANQKYEEYLYNTSASVVIVNKDFTPEKKLSSSLTLIKVDNAYMALSQLLQAYDNQTKKEPGIEKLAYINESAKIGIGTYIASHVYIDKSAVIGDNVTIFSGAYVGEGVEIGDNTIIQSGVRIYRNCKVGKNCIIHANSVIGADGFGFTPNSENNYQKVPQIGNVIIEDNVEIGALTSVDRATMGSTIIRKGVKLDNLIQIAHNVEVGENTVIAAQTGVAGSTKIGKDCMIGGQVGIVGHLKIGDRVKIAAQSGVGSNVPDDSIIQGSPAFSIGDYKRSYVGFRKLPQLMEKIETLEKELHLLKQLSSNGETKNH